MTETTASVAPQVRSVEQADPKLLKELDHVAYMWREGLLPKKENLKRIGQKEGMNLALEQRLKDGLEASDLLGVVETARLFPILDIKVPDQYRSILPNLVKQCEQHLYTQEIPYQPKEKRGMGRRRVLQVLGATVGLAATAGGGKVTYDTLNYGKKPTVATSPYNIRPGSMKEVNPEPTSTPEPEVNDFLDVLKPLIDYAQIKRAERAQADPDYAMRIDTELASRFLTFGLMTYWEEHGATYADMRGTITLISYDTKTNKVASISLSRDIRTPELERYLKDRGQNAGPQPMGGVFTVGGFELMRKVSEDVTGLPVDFQFVIKDTVIRDAINEISGPIQVDLPKAHNTGKWRFDGKEQDPNGSYIPAGVQTLDAMGAMRLILAEDVDADGRKDERSYRKNIVLRAVKAKLFNSLKSNPLSTKLKLAAFLGTRVARSALTKEILIDFDWNLVSRVLETLGKLQGKMNQIELPDINPDKEFVFHDPYFGDGGVTRAHSLKDVAVIHRAASPTIRAQIDAMRKENARLIQAGVKPGDIDAKLQEVGLMPNWMLVPDGGDPYSSSLPQNYWQTPRRLTKERLLK